MIEQLGGHSASRESRMVGGVMPVARPLHEFSLEQFRDEVILLDRKTMRYHALDAQAMRIWQACDGIATSEEIARDMEMPTEIIEITIGRLSDAGLLESTLTWGNPMLSRRRAAKLAAAGLVGTLGLPIVQSIVVPHAATGDGDGDGNANGVEELDPQSASGEDTVVYTAVDDVDYIDSSSTQPILTDEQQTVLDSAQATIDRADDVLNSANLPESTDDVPAEAAGDNQFLDGGAEGQGDS